MELKEHKASSYKKQQDITDVGADTSYVRNYMSNLIKTLRL